MVEDVKAGDNNIEDARNVPEPKNKKSKGVQVFNIILIICILIAVSYLGYVFLNLPEEEGDPPLPPEAEYLMQLPDRGIINIHEHIHTYDLGDGWLEAMERCNVSSTVMLGSPDATFLIKPTGHFNDYDKNNEMVVKLAYYYSDEFEDKPKFIAFPTVNSSDPDNLEKFKDLMSRGAWGLKLFTGHYASFYSYQGPLNKSSMYPIYEYCEKEKIPLIWHIHLGYSYMRDELEAVLADFPDLIIDVPHWGLRSSDLPTIEYFLDKYPNLYTDISFGAWAMDGFTRLSGNVSEMRAFCEKYQDRIMFGTDMVYTSHVRKTIDWVANITQGYVDLMSKKFYSVYAPPDVMGDKNGISPGDYNGLNLDQSILDKVFYDNCIKFLLCKPYTEEVDFDAVKSGDIVIKSRSDKTVDTSVYTDFEFVTVDLTVYYLKIKL
jgi:predicted TIM-barrel fold metal-dependent hydrolase